MDELRNIRVETDAAQGVVTAWFDTPGKSVNVLDETTLQDLKTLIDAWELDQVTRLIVLRSAKPGCFLAGADISQIEQLTKVEEVDHVVRAGHYLFDHLASLAIPTVAVIEGTCLGGGLELALACKHRIACDDAATRLGLPETQLGLIPGWGGTQRLPRLVGVASALSMILEGRRLSAAQSLKIGLVDAAVPRESFDAALKSFLAERLAGQSISPKKPGMAAWLRDRTGLGQRFVLSMARHKIARHARHYPALPAALTAISTGLKHGLARGLEAEREQFVPLVFSPTSKHLRQIFFQRERARKPSTWVGDVKGTAPQTVAVIGAGTMGAAIAQAVAISGCNVVLKDIEQRFIDSGLEKIDKLFRDAVKAGAVPSGEAEERRRAITATTAWELVAQADLAIEAVVEKLPVKQDVFRELDRVLKPNAVIVSNTSALPISELAAVTKRPSQVAGLHFFNPVHKMPLVEVVRCPGSNEQTLAALVMLVRQLGKVPIVVAESPGFLVNRVLFPYLDEAVRLVCEGARVEEVDRAATRFGMPMGPLELLDQVGIDVAADVAKTLAPFAAEPSPTPAHLAELVQAGRFGKKSGAGFYRYRNGHKSKAVTQRAGGGAAARIEALQVGDGEELSGTQQRLMFTLLNEAAKCLGERIVTEPWMVDLGLVMGTGYAPFRGGPMQTIDDWGVRTCVAGLMRLTKECGPRFAPCHLLLDHSARGGSVCGAKAATVTAAAG